MTSREEFNFFIEQLLDTAVKEFKTTEQYRLLQEKLDQMDRDCEFNLTDEAREFAIECFALILEVAGQEEHYVYRKGLTDGITILKRLGVLA
jgi:predicted ATP-grasp superfamily ATP-dependent carboligase